METKESNTTTSGPNNYAQAYFEIFLLSLTIVWMPSKLLAYLTPFACMAWFIIRSRSGKGALRLASFLAIYAITISIYALFYYIIGEEFVLQNALISIITYGSFIFFVVLPPNHSIAKINYLKYVKVIQWFILIESVLGIVQVMTFVLLNGGNFDSATGDVVQGTLSPISFINTSVNFNNQIYSANLLLLLLFYVPYNIVHKKGIWISAIGFIAILLASVMHLFIAFIVAIIIISVYFTSSYIKVNTSRLIIALFLVISLAFAVVLQPKNFGLVAYYFEKFTTNQSPKTVATIKALNDLPRDCPWDYVIGLGPGQYSSRAGLIGTGKYFGDFNKPKEIPFLEPQYTFAFKKHVFADWKDVATNVAKYGNSTMSRPFYSALSILTEFGYLFFTVIGILVFVGIGKLKKSYSLAIANEQKLFSFYAISCAVTIVFFIFISFFENYLEVTQAIFPGLLMLKFFHSYLKEPSVSAL